MNDAPLWTEEFASPSGRYRLRVQGFRTPAGTQAFTVGTVYCASDSLAGDQPPLAQVRRNFLSFWHAWVEDHPHGHDYLLCGEDYQGYTIVNLSSGAVHSHVPPEAAQGIGFCWTAAFPSPDKRVLAVDGCIWAAPYEVVFYDFSDPDCLPLAKLGRLGPINKPPVWEDNNTCTVFTYRSVRKADSRPYDELPDEEQDVLDREPSLIEEEQVAVRWSRGVTPPPPRNPPPDAGGLRG